MSQSVIKKYTMTCDECKFTTHDQALMDRHSCDIQEQGSHCEDYPACGHEWGDCNGLLYGSDEAIKEHTMRHINCDHEAGWCSLDDEGDDEDG